ncbi:MAG: GldM family protein [Bacteroidota bacterium]
MTNALKIRQKFINLMYLVFILFAFIYAPTNSLDSLFFTTKSLKRVGALLVPETAVLKTTINSDSTFIRENGDTYYSVMSLNDSVENVIKRLDSFQIMVIEPKYKGINDFPRNFRSASISNKTFIYNNAAENLRLSIDRIKTNLDKNGLGYIRKGIDSILPTKTEVLNSKGQERKWPIFFFAKTPKAVLLLTTEKMKVDLMTLSKDILTHLVNIRNKAKAEKELAATADNSMFIVKLLNGQEVPIKLDWTSVANDSIKERLFAEASSNKITGALTKDGAVISEATFNQKPTEAAPVKAEPMFAFIGKGAHEELYMGIDNPIDIGSTLPAGYRQEIQMTDGKVINKNGRAYLRFNKEGYTKIAVYAINGASKKLLEEREFKVILIPNPDVYLSGYKGGIISKDIVKTAKNIDLKSAGANLPDSIYTCESFDLTLIPFDNPIGELKVRGNVGEGFSAETKEILKNAKRGDVIVLDNFKIHTADGIVRRIPSVVYRVI